MLEVKGYERRRSVSSVSSWMREHATGCMREGIQAAVSKAEHGLHKIKEKTKRRNWVILYFFPHPFPSLHWPYQVNSFFLLSSSPFLSLLFPFSPFHSTLFLWGEQGLRLVLLGCRARGGGGGGGRGKVNQIHEFTLPLPLLTSTQVKST